MGSGGDMSTDRLLAGGLITEGAGWGLPSRAVAAVTAATSVAVLFGRARAAADVLGEGLRSFSLSRGKIHCKWYRKSGNYQFSKVKLET